MKQEVKILLPIDLAAWLVARKEEEKTTLSQIVVRALRKEREACE